MTPWQYRKPVSTLSKCKQCYVKLPQSQFDWKCLCQKIICHFVLPVTRMFLDIWWISWYSWILYLKSNWTHKDNNNDSTYFFCILPSSDGRMKLQICFCSILGWNYTRHFFNPYLKLQCHSEGPKIYNNGLIKQIKSLIFPSLQCSIYMLLQICAAFN